MEKSYKSKESLARDVMRQFNVCEGLTFSSVDDKDQIVFSLSVDLRDVPLRDITKYGDVANYLNGYFWHHLHLVKKEESVKL
jgi:hypothetical protein